MPCLFRIKANPVEGFPTALTFFALEDAYSSPVEAAVALWSVNALYGSKSTVAQIRCEFHSWKKRQTWSKK
jgi:hypothetical protein